MISVTDQQIHGVPILKADCAGWLNTDIQQAATWFLLAILLLDMYSRTTSLSIGKQASNPIACEVGEDAKGWQATMHLRPLSCSHA